MRVIGFDIRYRFVTPQGVFLIGEGGDGRFAPIFNERHLGSYARADQAAEDLAVGATFSAGVDTSKLGIPMSLSEWERVSPIS